MLQQGRLGSTDPTLIARDMEDVRQKISGSRVAESLNDLPGFLKAMDSQELGHARYRIVEGARQRLRPRRRGTTQPAGNDQQARGRLLNVEDVGPGKGPSRSRRIRGEVRRRLPNRRIFSPNSSTLPLVTTGLASALPAR